MYDKDFYIKNKLRIKESQQKYRKTEKYKKTKKRYLEKNEERLKKYSKEYYKNNKDKIKYKARIATENRDRKEKYMRSLKYSEMLKIPNIPFDKDIANISYLIYISFNPINNNISILDSYKYCYERERNLTDLSIDDWLFRRNIERLFKDYSNIDIDRIVQNIRDWIRQMKYIKRENKECFIEIMQGRRPGPLTEKYGISKSAIYAVVHNIKKNIIKIL